MQSWASLLTLMRQALGDLRFVVGKSILVIFLRQEAGDVHCIASGLIEAMYIYHIQPNPYPIIYIRKIEVRPDLNNASWLVWMKH